MPEPVIDWVTTYAKALLLRTADHELKSVLPDMGLDAVDRLVLDAAIELLAANGNGVIDLTTAAWKSTAELFVGSLTDIGERCDTTVVTER